MAIFGRITARQRLRRATQESLAIPAFSSPIDFSPWVTGGLWPAELSTITAETATLAEYLKADLQRIANSANDELKMIKRAGKADLARQAEEARVIDEARARAVRRVESTIRHLQAVKAEAAAGYRRPQVAQPPRPDMDKTQVIPVVTGVEPVFDVPTESAPEPRWEPVENGHHHVVVGEPAAGQDEPKAARHPDSADDSAAVAAPTSPIEETQVIPVVTGVEPVENGRHHVVVDEPVVGQDEPGPTRDENAADDNTAVAATRPRAEQAKAGTASDIDRLNRLLEFVVRQEPRLNWAVGDHLDGTTVLVTDLAHGWIPADIILPAGVRLLEPERRTGRASALIGDTTRVVTYAPGDSLRRSVDFAATKSSLQPRKLPAIEDLGRVLCEATRRRDGLPRIVQRLAEAAAAGTGVIDQEVDVLRVHVDTARCQLLVQYPNVNPALVLNCLLMAATEGIASGDSGSANYHLAWYQKLAAPPPSR